MISLRRSDLWFIWGVALLIVFGVVLNPFIDTWWNAHQVVLSIVAMAVLAALSLEIVRSLSRLEGAEFRDDATDAPDAEIALSFSAHLGVVAVLVAWTWLFRDWWMRPQFFADDFHYIAQSVDWPTARRNLFVPFNEHLVTTTRIVTWALVQIGGEHPERAFAAFTLGLFLLTSLLQLQLARRLGRAELPALIAFGWFVVSVNYSEIIRWYSAGQWLISTCLLISSLLLVDRPTTARLSVATIFSALAPWNYSIGVLVGPLTSLWLWFWRGRRNWTSLLPALAGVASTIAVMILVRRSMNEAEYWKSGGRGMLEVFDPLLGFQFSVRLFIERLLPTDRLFPWSGYAPLRSVFIVAGLGSLAVAGVRGFPKLARLWPIAAMIVVGYAVAIPFRTWQSYAGLVTWNRYQLIPQLGFSLLIAGLLSAVPALRGRMGPRSLFWFLAGLVLWTELQTGVVLRLYG